MDLYRVTKLPLYLLFTVHYYYTETISFMPFHPFELFLNRFYQLSLLGEFLNLNLPFAENMTKSLY